MCTAHYTEGVHLICDWEADKPSRSKDRQDEFGWLRDVQAKITKPADLSLGLQQKHTARIHFSIRRRLFHMLSNHYISISIYIIFL